MLILVLLKSLLCTGGTGIDYHIIQSKVSCKTNCVLIFSGWYGKLWLHVSSKNASLGMPTCLSCRCIFRIMASWIIHKAVGQSNFFYEVYMVLVHQYSALENSSLWLLTREKILCQIVPGIILKCG